MTNILYKGLIGKEDLYMTDTPFPLATFARRASLGTVNITKLPNFYRNFRPIENVMYYGAVGDGTTDDSTALNDAIRALSNGGDIFLPPGNYRITEPWVLTKSSLSSANTIRIWGSGYQNTIITLDDDTEAYALYFTGGHRLELHGFTVLSSVTPTEGTTWHSGIGISLAGSNFLLNDILVSGFTTGIYSTNGWSSTIQRSRVNLCQKGITLYGTISAGPLQFRIDRVQVTNNGDSGTPANGYGIKATNFNGSITGCSFESQSSSGLYLEASHGVDISGNNFETFLTAQSIYLSGSATGSLENIRNWTAGVNIQGNRFWNALGIYVVDGVGWVNIDDNSWVNSEPATDQLDATPERGLNVSVSDKNTIRKINYTTRNHWLHNVAPTLHNTATYGHAFTQDGVASLAALPSNGTYDVGDVIRCRTNRAFEWKCNTAGTYGTLSGITGTIVTGTDDQVATLNSLTGIFPGAQITIAGAGATGANLAVTVGGVDSDNLKIHFYPAASTGVTDAAISYTAPVFALTGLDDTVQSLSYAASVAVDLSLGGVISIGTLGGNIEIANPTNGVTGQRFSIRLLADGSGRSITYGSNFKGGTGSITANKRIVLEFIIVASNQIVQTNTPIEVD